jgi:hypothetical protein
MDGRVLVRLSGCLLVLLTASAAQAGLVAHFPFDGDTLDASGNANHGTHVGDPAVYVAGHDGTASGALSFNGTNNYVNVAQVVGLPLTNSANFSVAVWVNAPPPVAAGLNVDDRVFSESSTASSNPLYNIGTENTGTLGVVNIFVRRDPGGTPAINHLKTPGVAYDNTWHHLAVVDRDLGGGNREMRVYIDGVPDATFAYVLEPFTANITTFGGILRATACCWFTGALDDAYLFDHALDLAEIWALLPSPPGCIARFPFDGNTLDVSGNANHGTHVGDAAVYVAGYDGTPGGALSLNGTNNYVNVAQMVGLPLTNNANFSVAVWVNAPPPVTGGLNVDDRVFSESSTASNNPLYNIGTENTGTTGAVDIFVRRDPGGAAAINHFKTARRGYDNTWHHVAVVDEDLGAGQREMTVYVDGVPDAILPYVLEPFTANITTFGGILRGTPCCWFIGALDEACLFDRALSAEEVSALVPEPAGCPAAGDTTCESLSALGPNGETAGGGLAGLWTFTPNGVMDVSGDTPFRIFVAESGAQRLTTVATFAASASFTLGEGAWTVTCFVDDSGLCRDPAGECSVELIVTSEPPRTLARLPFDGDLLDDTGNGNDGTYVGEAEPPFVRGYDCAEPGALAFDGVDDYVDVATEDGLPVYNKPLYSIAMWVRGLPQLDRRVYSEANGTENNTLFNLGTQNLGTTGQVDIFIRDAAGAVAFGGHKLSDGVAFDGTWHHIAWTDASGNATLYIDGVEDTADFTYAKPTLNLDVATVGAVVRPSRVPPPCCWFLGEIDDVIVTNFILTADEVADLHAGGPPICTDPQIAGDCNQDGERDIADVLCLITTLFPGFILPSQDPLPLPCTGDLTSAGNVGVLSLNGDAAVNVSDVVFLSNYLFSAGLPPVQGEGCVELDEAFECGTNPSC